MPNQRALIRNRISLAGKTFNRDPYPNLTAQRMEALTVHSATGYRLDRPLYGGPTDPVFPNVREAIEQALPWGMLVGNDDLLEWIDTLRKATGPFPLVLWKQEYSVFDGDGVKKDFYPWRQQALPLVTPATSYADYPTRVDLFSSGLIGNPTPSDTTDSGGTLSLVHKNHSNIDTGNPTSSEVWIEDDGRIANGLKVSKLRFGTAPPLGKNTMRCVFIPVYWCFIKATGPIAYDQPNKETRSLSLVEAY